MTSKSPLTLAAAFALTVGIGYSICTLAFWLSPAAAAGFMTALFHGLDFGPLAKEGAFSVGSFIFALAVLMAWAFAFATCFGLLLERFSDSGDGRPAKRRGAGKRVINEATEA